MGTRMIMVYPYRSPNGNRSILQAVSLADARHEFSRTPGIVFCEIEKPDDFNSICTSVDLPSYVDNCLKRNPTFCT